MSSDGFAHRISLSQVNSVATITLDRGGRLNALDLASGRSLLAIAEELSVERDVRVIVIRASGDGFCGGGDVSEMNQADDREDYLLELTGLIHRALVLLAEHPALVITAVHGVVAGGGLGIMLAGDIVIAEASTKFTAAYRAIGLTPDCGVSTRLPAAIGRQRSTWFLLAGKPIDTRTAREWGLIAEITEPGQHWNRAAELAATIASIDTDAVRETARLIRWADEGTLADRLADEGQTIASRAGSSAAGALIATFLSRGR
jgi:2-(1,2-epoxy-1,2-dihydrophenyl)acetyl-CoA isomerase